MNRRTKTIVAGVTGAALTMGAVGAATAFSGPTPSTENLAVPSSGAVVMAEPVAATPQATRVLLYKMKVAIPEGWAAFYLNKNDALRAEGADVAELGDLAKSVRKQLSKSNDQSFMLIDMSTVGGEEASVTSMLFSVTKTGAHPVAESTLALRGWMDKVFQKVDATEAARFDTNKKRPSAWLEYTSENKGQEWLIREYLFQFGDRALSVHFATGANDAQAATEAATAILETLRFRG